jgi:mono/diheme cytochrome c family protein
MRSLLALIPPLVLLGGLTALAQGAGDIEKGRKMFVETGEEFDYPSCAHCHATVAPEEEAKSTGHIRPGFPVRDTAHRGAWKNKKRGTLATAADAGNICVVAFQKRARLSPARLADLEAYLRANSPDREVKPRKIGYNPALPASLDGGDAERGKKTVGLYCGGCHGKSDEHFAFNLRARSKKKRKVAMKVRGYIRDTRSESGMRFKPSSGMMSFFAKDRLPDRDLLDIIAYVGK